MKHQLETSRNNLKETNLPLHNVLLKHVDDAMERMAGKTDGEFIKQSILKMGELKITALKQKIKAVQLSERALYQFSQFFFEEAEALEALVGSIEKMLTVVNVLFSIQMVAGFWNNEMNFAPFKQLIEERCKVLEILREHGVMADA